MECFSTPKPRSSLRRQRPVYAPRFSPRSSTPVTQTLILSHPSARLSSSLASSPRVIHSPPIRTRSIRPEMSHQVDHGSTPGADFFEESTGDEDTEWEDDDDTRDFSEIEGFSIRQSLNTYGTDEGASRGRTRGDDVMRALPPYNQIPTHDSGTAGASEEELSPLAHKGTKKARQVSVRRLGKDKIVYIDSSASTGRRTPRDSTASDVSGQTSIEEVPQQFPEFRSGDGEVGVASSAGLESKHRRNTAESLRADSIINAHVITMRALESLPTQASLLGAHGHARSFSYPAPTHQRLESASFSKHRRILLPPLQTQRPDSERPAHLPNHFIKTPYPFSAKREFPKPRTRPRQHIHGAGVGEFDNAKGKHVLGIKATDGEYDLRSRLERNADAQGVINSRRDGEVKKELYISSGGAESARETVVWVSLRKRKRGPHPIADRLERIVVPSSLTTTTSEPGERKIRGNRSHEKTADGGDAQVTVDFDDMYFASRLRSAYKSLAGPWILRYFSAKKLQYIKLGQVSVWSGSALSKEGSAFGDIDNRLLASRGGLDVDADAQSPFTEHNLLALYRSPKTGKARYTWAHWTRRVAASNGSLDVARSSTRQRGKSFNTADQQLDSSGVAQDTSAPTPSSSSSLDSITTIQFVHSFSAARIFAALGVIIALSVLAPLLWIFLGESAWALPERRGKAERVTGGVLMGVLAFGVQMCLFGAWVGVSWWCV